MIKFNLTAERADIICSPDTLFPEYTSALEYVITWFFGRGISAFKVERFKNETKEQCLTVCALVDSRPLAYSQVTKLGSLVQDNYWPKELPFEQVWRLLAPRHEVRDGNHRLYRTNEEGTVIQQYGLNLEMEIGMLAYGLADLITGLFWLGATRVQYQSSVGLTQTMTDKGFGVGELEKYLSNEDAGYPVNQKVSTLQ